MILIALAAQLSAPVPTNLDSWFTHDDAPLDEMEVDKPKVIPFRAVVAPDGKLQDCQILFSSGSKRIDRLTCTLVKQRARFKPAIGLDGKPAYGAYRSSSVWLLTEGSGPDSRPVVSDMELAVSRLPEGVRSPIPVRVMFAVDRQGHVSSCRGEQADDNPALVKVACAELTKSFTPPPVRTRSGTAVDSVQDAVVLFVQKR
jgi:hypothetical protein